MPPDLPTPSSPAFALPTLLLSRPQMAFVRAWAEGLDLGLAWRRFLPLNGQADPRRTQGELKRLLDLLQGLARANGRPDLAGLLGRDPQAMPDSGACAPTLEAFREQQPADLYSEAELLALYQAQHGRLAGDPARLAAQRRQRLRQRLLAALQWLEGLAARAPQPQDPVTVWLEPRLAARLAGVGIHDLSQLVVWVRSKGFHWHRTVPRVGARAAARAVAWLQQHEATLGALPCTALVAPAQLRRVAPAPAPLCGIASLERFVPPVGLDGAAGARRAPQARCRLAARTDVEAVNAWLGLHAGVVGAGHPGTHTWRAYRKEAERFLLWAMLARRKALSSLDGEDCAAYRGFLGAPGPHWCAPRHTQRWRDTWRPFEGPLSARSAATAVAIVRALCAWLARQRYLDSNPWDEAPPPSAAAPAQQTAPLRALSPAHWQRVQDWLADPAAVAAGPAAQRLAFLLTLAHTTGLRLSELAAARTGWLRQRPGDGGVAQWWLQVPGAGQKQPREVPLPDQTVAALRACLADRGLGTGLLDTAPETPLLAQLGRNAPLSSARIYQVLVQAFERCAAHWAALDPEAAQRIGQASSHWLRHTHGAHAAEFGVSQAVLQANLGHRSAASTAIYLRSDTDTHTSDRRRSLQAAFGVPRASGGDLAPRKRSR